MSAVLHMPVTNTAPFMLKEKLGDPFAPAFTAVNGRPAPSSTHAPTGLPSVTAWTSAPRDPTSPPAASHSVSPTMTTRDRSPDSPFKRKRSRSPDPQRPHASSREGPAPAVLSPTASYPDPKPSIEVFQRTLPPILQSERRWNPDSVPISVPVPVEYQEHHHHESRPTEPPHHMPPPPPPHVSDPHEYEDGVTEQSMLEQHDQKRTGRKRQFANRTKTGCGTCRKRKKKCDEAKPKCNNCLRGNFECLGYANKTSWPKDGASKAPPALQAKERVASVEIPARYARCGVCNQVHIPHCELTHKPYSESNGSDGARARPVSEEEQERKSSTSSSWTKSWTESSRYETEHPPPPPPPPPPQRQHNPRVYHHTPQTMGQPTPSHPAIAAQPAQYAQPPPSASSHERPPIHDHHASRPPPPPPPPLAMAPMAAAPPAPSPPRYLHPALPPRSEKDKMLAGEPFLPYNDVLINERTQCSGAVHRFNSLSNAAVQIAESERQRQFEYIIAARWIYSREGEYRITGHFGGGINVAIPFHCDYGYNISIGDNVVIGPGSQFLDSGRIAIGRNTKIGARVTISTIKTPSDTKTLKGSKGTEIAREVYIGENVYIGESCVIEAGVRIGNNAIIRPGSVVVRDVPADCVAVGNPAEVRQVHWKD